MVRGHTSPHPRTCSRPLPRQQGSLHLFVTALSAVVAPARARSGGVRACTCPALIPLVRQHVHSGAIVLEYNGY